MCAFLKLLTFPNNVLTQSLNLPWCILFNILNVDDAKPSVRGVIYVHLQCQYVEVGHEKRNRSKSDQSKPFAPVQGGKLQPENHYLVVVVVVIMLIVVLVVKVMRVDGQLLS